jgi:hypothetical protein
MMVGEVGPNTKVEARSEKLLRHRNSRVSPGTRDYIGSKLSLDRSLILNSIYLVFEYKLFLYYNVFTSNKFSSSSPCHTTKPNEKQASISGTYVSTVNVTIPHIPQA